MKFKDTWQRHSVAVPNVVRTIHRVAKAPDWTKAKPKSIMRTYEETVHANDVYRRKDLTKEENRVLWHRGARVGVA